MRSEAEIVARIREIENVDFFGFKTSDLLERLSFEAAKPWLKPEATEDEWVTLPADTESVVAGILAYMPFAWDKANNCRGLSAMRSLDHMSAWCWLAGEDGLVDMLAAGYDRYGKPQLREICEKFGWDWRQWDDGDWTNDEMSPGVPADEVPRIEVTA